MPERPTEIYRAANPQQAQLLRGLLEERGIQAFVVNDYLQGAGGDLPLGWTAAPRILVAEEDAPKARVIAEQFDATLASGGAVALDEFEVAEADWSAWPLCPACSQRREVLCEVCGSTGTKFALADLNEGRSEVLLHCPTCDDHFRPKFFRICHHCGHDYGNGIKPEKVVQEITLPENSRRTWIVIISLLLFATALGSYLVWLMRR